MITNENIILHIDESINNLSHYAMNTANDDDEINNNNIDEWSNVPKIEAKYATNNNNNNITQHFHQTNDVIIINNSSNNNDNKLIDFNNAYDELYKLYSLDHSNNLLNESDEINNNSNNATGNHYHHHHKSNNNQQNFITKFLSKLFGPTKLHSQYKQNRDFIYLLATKQFDETCLIHKQILFSIYRKLTSTNVDCPRFGTHWEMIGFQGVDPATDLRGCGILSLLLTLYLFDDKIINNLTHDIYRLSLHETQNFPFAVMGINLIRIMLQVVRQNQLNTYFNKSEGNLVSICGKFYIALYLELYLKWKNEFKTIKDSGFLLRDIETKAKKSPKYFFNQLDKYIKIKEKEYTKFHQTSYKFVNVPKIVIQKAESTEQEFTTLE